MSVWLALYLALSFALAVGIFWISDDEPFTVRVVSAAVIALLWLPGLILLALMMLTDGVASLIVRLRK